MNRNRAALMIFLAGAAAPAQDVDALVREIRAGENRTRALAELARVGEQGTAALADAMLTAVRAKGDDALRLAEALAEVRHAEAVLPQILEAIPIAAVEVRDPLLHALGNGVLLCADDEQVGLARDAVAEWAGQGMFYSPSASEPTFAWYEYVRIVRRLTLRRGGADLQAVQKELGALRASREGGIRMFGALVGEGEMAVHDLSAHGQHGHRELLEAVAELVSPHGKAATEAVRELARYLEHEVPRPGIVLTEHCAGIGENAPVPSPATQFPTLWRRDDWRFSIARTVLLLHDDAEARTHALRHLLYAPTAVERIDALARVRQWSGSKDAFAPDLVARLDDTDRTVVREALVTLGLFDGIPDGAQEALHRLAGGDDGELATLARRLLTRLKER